MRVNAVGIPKRFDLTILGPKVPVSSNTGILSHTQPGLPTHNCGEKDPSSISL